MIDEDERREKLLQELHRIQSADLLDEIDEEADRLFDLDTLFDLDEFEDDDQYPHYYRED